MTQGAQMSGPVKTGPPMPKAPLGRTVKLWSIRVVTFIGLLAAWQWFADQTNPALFASPGRTIDAFIELAIESNVLWAAIVDSLGAMLLGLGIAIPVGIAIGALMGRFRTVEYVLDPYVSFIYALPIVVLIPLIVVWLGIGTTARVFMVFLTAVIPIIINTMTGAKQVDRKLLDVARAHCATSRQELLTVVIPGLLPYLFTALQLAAGVALVGMVVAELLVVVRGLGGLLLISANAYKPAEMFVPLFAIVGISVLLTKGLEWLRRLLMPWERDSTRQLL